MSKTASSSSSRLKRRKVPAAPHVDVVRDALSTLEEMAALAWIDVEEDLPEANLVVMIFCPRGIERVWMGYYDETDAGDAMVWRDMNGVALDGTDAPTMWRDMPSEPRAIGSGVGR
jgi:hypothetical protein